MATATTRLSHARPRAPRPTLKSSLYAAASAHGPAAALAAAVILDGQPRAARRLAGLVGLLDGGHDVRTAEFSIDVLLVDGEVVEWGRLEALETEE